jgi:hypothetical protein
MPRHRKDALTVAFIPAWRCDRATHYLMWERLRGNEYGWTVTAGTQLLGALDGYPVGAPARTHLDAVPWAAGLTGIPADRWIQQPARSGAYHTHHDNGRPCTRPEPNP